LKPFTKNLLRDLNNDGGMPYAPGMPSFSEATLLTILAFIATEGAHAAQPLIDWVLKNRNRNGSIGLNPEFPDEGLWNTPLLAIVMHHLGLMAERDAAIDFILGMRSRLFKRSPDVDLDPEILGWSWVPQTTGWVEPTSWALLALNIVGKENHPRAIEGRKLLEDRCIPEGGWNYGNKTVFNHTLMPFWDTTALALLALGETNKELTSKNIDFLERSLPEIHSLYSSACVAICLERFSRDTNEIRARIRTMLEGNELTVLNVAHSALGMIALSDKRVFTT
jgi:hypothetical protein